MSKPTIGDQQQLRERLDGLPTDNVALPAVLSGSLVASFLLFLLDDPLAVIPLLGFFVTVGYGWVVDQDVTARVLTFVATASTIAILGLITVFIFYRAIPAVQAMGFGIVGFTDPVTVFGVSLPTVETYWSTGSGTYSLIPMIWGTFVTTAIAMVIAGPLGIAGAVFLAEIAPPVVREAVKPGVEILAGIPSIVYGYLGFVTLNRFFFENLRMSNLGSLFLVGLVIGLMSLPTVVSVADDALSSVPASLRDGSVAMGATEWQTIKSITMPTALSGLSAAVLLGIGRAVGETMAATVIIGHSQRLPDPLGDVFASTETLTSLIASQYGNANGEHMSALFAAGVVLFVTVLTLSIGARRVELRMEKKLGGHE